MGNPNIIVPPWHKSRDHAQRMAEQAAIESNAIPLRIKCPECKRIYTIYIEDLRQGMHTILGQACRFCKRFIKESDDPVKILADYEELKMKQEDMKNG